MKASEIFDDPKPVVLWWDPSDLRAAGFAMSLIEEGQDYQLSSKYSARYDVAYQPNQKNHTHVYLKGNEVCVVNNDGTPSHGSPPFSTLPTKIQAKIRALKLVESAQVLKEQASIAAQVLIPRSVLTLLWIRLLDS